LAVKLEGLFWTQNKMGFSLSLSLPLEASHYARLKAPIPIYCFYDYLQPMISLDSQQSLAIQSHGLSTWTALSVNMCSIVGWPNIARAQLKEGKLAEDCKGSLKSYYFITPACS